MYFFWCYYNKLIIDQGESDDGLRECAPRTQADKFWEHLLKNTKEHPHKMISNRG